MAWGISAAASAVGSNPLPAFADIHFPGLNFSMQAFAAEVTRQTGRSFRVKPFGWWTMTLLQLF